MEADLTWEGPTIDAYEATFIDPPVGFWRKSMMKSYNSCTFAKMFSTGEMIQLVGMKRQSGGNDKRRASVA